MNRSSRAGALHEVHMQHLDEGTIHAWLDGALPADEAESVAKHVDECRECAANVAEARGMIVAAGNIVSALDHVRGGVIPTPSMPAASQHSLWRRLRFTPARAALAATLLVAVASLLTVRYASEPDVAPFDRSQAAPAAAPAVVASQAPAAPPVQDSIMVAKKAAPLRVRASTAATAQAQTGTRDSTRSLNAMSPKPKLAMEKTRGTLDSVSPTMADRAAQSVAAAPPPSSANAVTGGAQAKAADLAERKTSGVTRLEQVMTTGATVRQLRPATGDLEGCYQIRSDSTSSALAPPFPQRFALMNTRSGPDFDIRSVSPEGRIDSVLPGGTWQRLTAEVVRVQFANAREQQPLTLQLTAGSVTGRATVGSQTATVPVARIDCRR
jgi:anti-sigma factor RsiW